MTPDTVPLGELVGLAKLVAAMRRAQRAFFEERKRSPSARSDQAYREARDLERRVDSCIADVLTKDRQVLPGLT